MTPIGKLTQALTDYNNLLLDNRRTTSFFKNIFSKQGGDDVFALIKDKLGEVKGIDLKNASNEERRLLNHQLSRFINPATTPPEASVREAAVNLLKADSRIELLPISGLTLVTRDGKMQSDAVVRVFVRQSVPRDIDLAPEESLETDPSLGILKFQEQKHLGNKYLWIEKISTWQSESGYKYSGRLLIQKIVELSFQRGFEGRVRLDAAFDSPGFYLRMGFKSPDEKIQERLRQEFDEANESGVHRFRTTIDESLILELPAESREKWKRVIEGETFDAVFKIV